MHTGRALLLAALGWSGALATFAQSAPPAPASIEDLRVQMQDLRSVLEDVRRQLAASNAETAALRHEVQTLRAQLPASAPASVTVAPAVPVGSGAPILADLADQQNLLAAKVNDQYQTKVESASKYKVRLSGMALFNTFNVRGAVDNLDLPETAGLRAPGEPSGSTGATVRQSILGIEVFGPQWGGARTSGEIKVDFFGGFPATPEGVTAGLLRLRTARLNLDWKNTSIAAGQDALFFSPLSPTSLASTAYPALSGAGNLWTWTPQIYVERRFNVTESSRFSMQWGVLDALTGERPLTEYDRTATAGEHSRIPAYAARLAWQSGTEDGNVAIGVGSYYSRQDWSFGRTVNSWAVTSDWDVPLGKWFALSGELYRGRAIAGLGGGATGSVIFAGEQALSTTPFFAIDSAGGWAQLKFQPTPRLQSNFAFGKDASLNGRLETLLAASGVVHRNASGFANVIFQARSNLLFSIEYRRLWTSRYGQPLATADHIGLAAGILF
jgi:hypothetical protein